MGSHHHSDRRQFLTEGAALASLAVGAVQSVGAQTPQPEPRFKDTLAYGQPVNRPVTSIALNPDGYTER
jgi:hypothetical protein